MLSSRSYTKHVCHCFLLFFTVFFSFYTCQQQIPTESKTTPPLAVTVIFIVQQIYLVLFLPVAALFFLGLVVFKAFPDEVRIIDNSKRPPFVCIRIVTKGLFPELVIKNARRNIETCLECGLQDFVVEVVTDNSVNLPHHPRLREIVVPTSYRTKNGTLFKARALQYCLEEGVNLLNDNDWIVHLDEETIMTPSSVRGIVNFIQQDKHQLGQGLITYANERVVNWITTLLDTVRVSEDLGVLRFQLRVFHRVLLGWKGSFLVVKRSVEKDITFDHGPKGSIVEDITFGLLAAAQGYSFDFVEGEMWEKSPFTLKDLIKQRTRWMQGSLLICMNPNIPYSAKLWFCMFICVSITSVFVSPFLLLTIVYPMSTNIFYLSLRSFIVGTFIYTFIFGILRSISLSKVGFITYILMITFSVILLPSLHSLLGWLCLTRAISTKKIEFYIVQK